MSANFKCVWVYSYSKVLATSVSLGYSCCKDLPSTKENHVLVVFTHWLWIYPPGSHRISPPPYWPLRYSGWSPVFFWVSWLNICFSLGGVLSASWSCSSDLPPVYPLSHWESALGDRVGVAGFCAFSRHLLSMKTEVTWLSTESSNWSQIQLGIPYPESNAGFHIYPAVIF